MNTTTKNKDELEQEEQGIIGLNGNRYVTDAPGLPEGMTLYKPNKGSADANNTGSKAGSSYSYAQSAPGYVNQYQNAIEQMRNGILNREAFAYDPANDPTYQQYADSYTRQGKQAMEDTLAQVSARTGGLASSYAGTAAQQTYNGYMSALADKVPELRQLAYQMYMDEGDTMRQNLDLLQGLEATEYGRYRDSVEDNKWQQTFDTQNSQWQQKFDYDKNLAAAQLLGEAGDYSGYQGVFSLSDEQAATLSANYDSDKLLAAAELMAQAGDFSGYKSALNLTDEQVATLEAWYQKQNAPKVTGGGGGDQSMTLTTAKEMAKQGQFTDEVLRVLRNAGFNDEYLKLEYGYEPELEDEQPYSPPPAVTNGEYGESYDATMRAVGHSLNVKDPKSALPGIIKWLEENNPSLTTEGWDLIYGYIEQKTGVPVEQW